MKKHIACTLILLTITMLLTAPAFAQTSKEILFRGQAWDQSCVDYCEAVASDIASDMGSTKDDVTLNTFTYDSGFSCVDVDEEGFFTDIEFQRNIVCVGKGVTKGVLKVAGYPLTSFQIYALPKVEGEELLTNPDENQVVRAMYIFSLPSEKYDPETVRKDLIRKLSSLYGEVDLSTEVQPTGGIIYRYIWFGGNNTFVMLNSRENSGSTFFNSIVYGHTDDELIEEIQAIEAGPAYVSDSVQGL